VLREDTCAMVKKSLRFNCEQERETIRQMVHFLKAARHDSLLNLEKVLEAPNEVQLYYEYAPFKLEKWIATVNEDLLVCLEEQMLELAEYLSRSSIRFTFDPECLGLSSSMTIKYFLSEFSLDFEGEEQHLAELRLQIGSFFKELACCVQEAEREVEVEQKEEAQCVEIEDVKCPRLESLSTNASISPLDELIELTHSTLKKNEEKNARSSQLSAKVESSMKKSLEALMRFKRNAPK
jgi:hypothetical protein